MVSNIERFADHEEAIAIKDIIGAFGWKVSSGSLILIKYYENGRVGIYMKGRIDIIVNKNDKESFISFKGLTSIQRKNLILFYG